MSEHQAEIDRIADVLLTHRDSGVTPIVDEEKQQFTGAHAWCYCGGTKGIDWIKDGPAWRGTFKTSDVEAQRELRVHIATAIVTGPSIPPEVIC